MPGNQASAGPPAVPFTDRSDRLVAMGIIQIILGGLSGLMVLLTVGVHLSGKLPRSGAYGSASTTLSSVFTLALVTVFFIWSGVGALKKQRWVRPLMLSMMWPALLIGTTMLFVMIFVMPEAFDRMTTPGGSALPERAKSFATTLVLVISAVVYFVIPLLHILLYTNPEVQRTCEKHDSRTRWTDGCPVPVLALAIWLATGALFVVLAGLTTPVLPAFGKLITGWPATLGCLVIAGVLGFLARAVYRRAPKGLWGTLALLAVGMTSLLVTYFHVDTVEWLRASGGLEAAEARFLEPVAEVLVGPFLGVSVFWGVITAAYLVYLVRFFRVGLPGTPV